MARKLKIMENGNFPLTTWKMTKSLKNVKNEKCTLIGPGRWQEKWKSRKMRNTHFRTWIMVRKTEKGGKFRNIGRGIWQENWKSWKIRNIHLTTWKMTKSLKNVKNEKCTLKDLEYGENTENHGKWEIHTLGR